MDDVEDAIYEDRRFIKRLEETQNECFDKLSKRIGLNALGDDCLFDYVFNSEKDTDKTFGEYLEDFGHTIKQLKL